MPITINGNGTIAGVSVGGLPDAIVDADMIAADAVTAAKIGVKTFVSYAVICDQKAAGTNGGTFTSGAWRTRDLNTEPADPDGIVSISSNQFTLGAGTYLIEASASAYNTGRHLTRIYNATSTSVVAYGQLSYTLSSAPITPSAVVGRVTIAGDTAFEIQHRAEITSNLYGYGFSSNFGNVEIYTVVKIYKEA